MESKDLNQSMGLPAGAISGSGTSMNITHNGNSDGAPSASAASAPAAPAPMNFPTVIAEASRAPSAMVVDAPATVTPTPVATTIAAATPSPLQATPIQTYMPNMSSAIVPFSAGGFAALGLDTMKKKRGRPRKYGPGGSLALSVTPLLALSPSSLSPSQKRGRGRPLGSGKNQQLAALGELMLGSMGAGFTPHAITVATGEDIASRIMSFSQQGPRGICILSANGAVSSVTLRQPSISGGIITYEGRFEILSLSGSFLLTDFGGSRSRTGGLSVSLAGPDGRVVGGGVAGILIAASPVQVIVGSFMCNAKRLLPKPPKPEAVLKPTPLNVAKPVAAPTVGAVGANSSIEESERKPVLPKSGDVERGTMGGGTSSESASRQVQAISPRKTSPSPPPMVSEERQHGNSIPLRQGQAISPRKISPSPPPMASEERQHGNSTPLPG